MDKRPIFDWFYEQGDIYVTVITTNSSLLKIPQESMKKKFDKFVIGAVSTPSLSYNDTGINVAMRFGSKYEECFLPWESVVIIEGDEAVIQFAVIDIEDDMEENGESISEQIEEANKKKGTHLTLVE